MSCNCGQGCGSALAVMQQGDTFPVFLQYKEDDAIAQLGINQSIVMAFYNYKGERILTCSTDDGSINYSDNYYVAVINHEDSVNMVGKVYVELTLIDNDGSMKSVYHGDKIPSVKFEPRRNNEIV